MNIKEFVRALSSREEIVISDRNRAFTGPEFVREIESVASCLIEIGVRRKSVVFLRTANTADCVATCLGILLCGGVVFVCNPYDPLDRLNSTIDRYLPYLIVSDNATAQAVRKLRGDNMHDAIRPLGTGSLNALCVGPRDSTLDERGGGMRDADVAIFSSGSTGQPKAILHSWENLFLNAVMHAESIGLVEGDRVGAVLPIYFSYGLVATVLSSLVAGATLVIYGQKDVVDESWIRDNHITVLGLTPYFARLLSLRERKTSLRVLTFGGDALFASAANEIKQNYPGCELYSTYGLTEAGPRVATYRFDNVTQMVPEVMPLGTPLSGVRCLVCDDRGNSVSGIGELVVETKTPMLGYYHGVKSGFESAGGNVIHTGDIFEERSDGLYFVGRKKDIIVQCGEKLFPIALESVIHRIDGVFDVRVDGIPDAERGEVAKAYIHASEHVTTTTIRRALLKQFSHASLPRYFEFVDSIPRSPTGKKTRSYPVARVG